ncbi:MAG: CPBP family intramembrane metalloprotease [Clostridia bacterium]|nr:CPBP family intramembrane metalloprotease [Clostridia bacterium]
MRKKELIIIGILTILVAFMDISGFPSVLFINIRVWDITPFYWTLMFNFIIIGIIAFLTLKYLCPNWKLGFNKKGLKTGLKKYGIVGIIAGIISGIAFYIGLRPFNYNPTTYKVLIEGIIYYIGVAIVEELYVRGLLLNFIEKLCHNKKNNTQIAVILSSVIFGLGHIFGVLGQPILIIVTKVIWTIAMGMYFGTIYKKTNNLWLPIVLHFIINVCALPYCFTTITTYPNISLYIILPTYLLLGIYSLYIMKQGS